MALSKDSHITLSTQKSWAPVCISLLAKYELSRLLNPASHSDYRILAGYLGFTDTDIQNYEARNGASLKYNATVEVLRDWEKRFPDGPQVEELFGVLEAMGREDAKGVIRRMLENGTFWDRQVPPSPQDQFPSANGGPPGGNSGPPSFPAPPTIPGFSPDKEGDIFDSDLDPSQDSRRKPVERSFSSLISVDHPPAGETDQRMPFNYPAFIGAVRPKIRTPNFGNLGPPVIPPPLPPDFNPTAKHHQQQLHQQHETPISSRMSSKGQEKRSPSSLPPGAIPKRNNNPHERRPRDNTEAANLQRTNSCHTWSSSSTHTSSSGTSSTDSYESHTWPSGKENPMRKKSNAMQTDGSDKRTPLQGIPGDYQSMEEREIKSWPMDHRQKRDQTTWPPAPDGPTSHRQIGKTGNSLNQVANGVSPAPRQCRSGFAYGITFAWKDWKCGMELARKLKREGHHVEVDRKSSWYQNQSERDRILTNVFNSCTYIVVIYTPHYESEVRGEVVSPINTRFLNEYMRREYERTANRNLRFIPIVDVTRIPHPEAMFQNYPVEQHRYIVRLIRQQGVIVERQISLN